MSRQRETIINLIKEAQVSGARQSQACEVIGISAKTLQRWRQPGNDQDGRLDAHHEPSNKLTELECQRIIKVANESEYTDLPPNKIVPKLADKGLYIASESSFYRILKKENQLSHRQKSKPTRQIKKPKALIATGSNQIYSWDITYLPTLIKGLFLYLYLVLDVYSRKIVGWQVYENESSALAADLMTDICQREGIVRNQVTLHSDNGSPMKGATMLATLQQLGVIPSFSRPSVSNDNPFSESLFRTLKYRPEYPERPFVDLLAARTWVQGFVDWYNHEHLHSSIKFVTPEQRHQGMDSAILAKREQVYRQAKSENPRRWRGEIRNWDPIKEVYLNPEKQKTDNKEKEAA
jgi:transposase InsO family protein